MLKSYLLHATLHGRKTRIQENVCFHSPVQKGHRKDKPQTVRTCIHFLGLLSPSPTNWVDKNNRNVFSHSWWSKKPKTRSWQRWFLLEALREFVHTSPPSGGSGPCPWSSLPGRCLTAIPASVTTQPSLPWVRARCPNLPLILKKIYCLILEREEGRKRGKERKEGGKEREKNTNLLSHLLMHSLHAPCTSPWPETKSAPLASRDNAPTTWATWPGPRFTSSYKDASYTGFGAHSNTM